MHVYNGDQLLVVGGESRQPYGEEEVSNVIYRIDTKTWKWEKFAETPCPLMLHCGLVLRDKYLVFFSGTPGGLG